MKQDEYSTARPMLKRWSNRSPTVEPRWAWAKTGNKLQATCVSIFRPEPSLSLRPVGVQLKRAATLSTVIGFTTKHTVCRITFMLYPFFYLISHLSPSTSEVVGAPQMTLQQYFSTLPCLPLPSGKLHTPFPSIPWSYLPISSSVFLSFLLLSLSPAELSSPCPRISGCGHTIWVSFSLPWLGDHHALQLQSGFCCKLPRSSHGLCRKYSEVSNSISSQGLGPFSRFLLSRPSSHSYKGR